MSESYPVPLHVTADGSDTNTGRTWDQGLKTIAAALVRLAGWGRKGHILLGPGDIEVGSGVVWPNQGIGMTGFGPAVTRLVATGNAGPVLDLNPVAYQADGIELGGFSLHGDGTPGMAKIGLRLPTRYSMTRSHIRDIEVRNTGGPCFDFGITELCTLSRLVAYTPVGAGPADIPYMIAEGQFNGNVVDSCLLVGATYTDTPNVGPSGAVVIRSNSVYPPVGNHITDLRAQSMVLADGGTVLSYRGVTSIVSGFKPFDCRNANATDTGTSYIRLEGLGSKAAHGGNMVTGVIPGGKASGVDGNPDPNMGVDVRQSYNRVSGIKGYNGLNVRLAPGVMYCDIELRGQASQPRHPGCINESGNSTNRVSA